MHLLLCIDAYLRETELKLLSTTTAWGWRKWNCCVTLEINNYLPCLGSLLVYEPTELIEALY